MNESTTPNTSSSSSSPSPGARPWLSGRITDVLIGCGLLSLPLAFASDFASQASATAVVGALAALALVINGPHYGATALRAWRAGGAQRRFFVGASVIAVFAVVAAHAAPALLPWLFTAFLVWSPWHYAAQNHRVSLVLLARLSSTNADPAKALSAAQRRVLQLAHAACATAAVVSTQVGAREAFVLRLGVSRDLAFGLMVACAGVAGVATVAVVVALRGRAVPLRAQLAVLALLSTSAVWFVVPALVGSAGALAWVGGIFAVLHGAQYLWFVRFAESRAAFVAGRSFDGFAWYAVALGVGVALFTLVPWIVSKVGGFDLVVSLLIVQAVVNLHHMTLESVLWRLRDPALAQALFVGDERAASGREQVSNLRAVVVSLPIIALLLLGVVDVLQGVGTRLDAPPELALRAAVLNENDSRVWLQSAQLAADANDADGARADLGRAIDLSPWNLDAQRALARLHVAAGRDEEAWSRFGALPAGLQDELDTQLLFSSVALRLGERGDAALVERALDLATRALVHLDGTGTAAEIEARRVRGTALLDTNKAGDGRTELKRALDDAQQIVGEDPLPRGQLLDLGLALADADVALKQDDPALALYQRCLDGSTQANRPDVAFRALTARARLFDQRGKHDEALDAWQRALSFADDVEAAEPGRVAQAWLDYASLLARSEAPMRIRYTCGLKARAAAEKMPAGKVRDDRLAFITEATRYVEEVLSPADAEDVRKDVKAAAKAALTLAYPDDAEGTDSAPAVPPALTP